jgi:bifunctional non-homologous end joining protein LigD
VARYARAILKDMGLDPMPVTSGSKGIHLYAGLDGRQSSEQVSDVAHELARALEAEHPTLVVSDMKRALRSGKVFVDWSQNSAAKTTVTPYSLRGGPRPLVAVPRTWRELDAPGLAQLDYEQVLTRMKKRKDPLAALAAGHPKPPGTVEQEAAEPPGEDRLVSYRAKRDAAKTPEPMPATTAPLSSARQSSAPQSEGRSFVIQEHHARRLHYDFRLEHDGVLVSWALPKGVPTDVKKNHLAVQTEDHPLEYGSFEGRIPAGEYGGGEVTIWDSGSYTVEKWRDGKEIIVTLHGEPDGALGGPKRIALIHTGGDERAQNRRAENNWLIHLMKDSPAPAASTTKKPPTTAKAAVGGSSTAVESEPRRITRVAPMLATLGSKDDIDAAEDWAFEMKWDGIRALAHLGDEDDDIRLFTRNGNDATASYPEVVRQLRESVGPGRAVLDGEIVALNSAARPDFGLLQTRMGLTRQADVERAARSAPVQYLLFDLLERGDAVLTDESYDERRRALIGLIRPKGPIQVPPAFEGDFDQAMSSSRELQLEGVVAKKRDGTYSVGRRSRTWIKVKHHRTQEVVIGGWRPGKGRRAGGVGSLLVGIPEAGTLRYVGRVGTGFGDRELDAIAARLRKLQQGDNPFTDVPRLDASDAHWVRPGLVAEVEFSEWTSTGRLRQPSWRGWRPDKTPDQVSIEN